MLDEFPHIKVVSDEVYDFLTFDKRQHHYFATVGNNWGRTVTLFSGGKLLAATGWKVGWAVGPAELINLGGVINSAVYYCFNHPGQVGVGNTLEKAFSKDWAVVKNEETGEDEHISYAEEVCRLFEWNRTTLFDALLKLDIPIKPVETEGGYFLMADVTDCEKYITEKYLQTHDYETPESGPPISKCRAYMPGRRIPLDMAFCRWIAIEHGVTMMPNSCFYDPTSPDRVDNFVRMGICKQKDGMHEAINRLKKVKAVEASRTPK